MPGRGSKSKTTQEEAAQPGDPEFTSFDQVAAKLSSDFNSRFGKIENMLQAISAVVPALAAEGSEPPAKKQANPATVEPHQTRSRGPATTQVKASMPPPVKNLPRKPSATVSRPPVAQMDAIDDAPPEVVPIPEEPAAIFNPRVNINNNIPTWITSEIQHVQPATHTLPLSSREFKGNDALDDQVQQILVSTAHQLSKGNRNDKSFPCKYIIKGPDRKPANVNTVTMQEHLWGLSRMIRDPAVSPDIKPLLYVHLEEILEDARNYDWPSAVRAWSEECFSQVEEKRLSWHETAKIQMLRTSMSRTSTARISAYRDNSTGQKDNSNRTSVNRDSTNAQRDNTSRQPRQQQYYSNYELYKGGPPCPDFNSSQGCNHQSGHQVGGRRMMHICAYCLAQTSALNPHPEAFCRNKQRHANYHF